MNYKVVGACKQSKAVEIPYINCDNYGKLEYQQTEPSLVWTIRSMVWHTADILNAFLLQDYELTAVPFELVDEYTIKLSFTEAVKGTAIFIFNKDPKTLEAVAPWDA